MNFALPKQVKLNYLAFQYFFFLFNRCLFILKEREKERGGGRERKGDRKTKQVPHCQHSANTGLCLMNHEIMTRGLPNSAIQVPWHSSISYFYFYFIIYMYIYIYIHVYMYTHTHTHIYRKRERERESKQSRGAKGEKERISSRLHAQQQARCRAGSHNPGIMT